jgi:hypothetical protein
MPAALSIVVDEEMIIHRFSELNGNRSHYPPDFVIGHSLIEFRLLYDSLVELIDHYWPWIKVGHPCRVSINSKLSGREIVAVTPLEPVGWAHLTLYSSGRGEDAVSIHKNKYLVPPLQLPGAS